MKKDIFLIIALFFFLTPTVAHADEFTVSDSRMDTDGYLTVEINPTPPDNICSWWHILHFVYLTDSNGNRVGGFGGCSNNGDGTYTMTGGQVDGYLPDSGTYRVEVNEIEQPPHPYELLSSTFDWVSPLPHINRAPSLAIPDNSRPLSDIPSLRQVYVDLGQPYSSSGYFTDSDSTSWTATVDYGDGGGTQGLSLDGYNFSLNHTYARGGSYTVTVKIKDDQGVEGAIQRVVSVMDYNIQASNPRVVNGSFTVDLHGFPPDNICSWFPAFKHDAYVLGSNGQVVGGFSSCSSNGDGNYTISGGSVGGQGTPPDGTYSIKVEEREQPPYPYEIVTNSFTWIANYPPTIDALPNVTLNEGSNYSVVGSFDDPESTSWTATVNYGDGSGMQPLALSGNNFSLNHQYQNNGIYTVVVTVTDNQNAVATENVTITVNNVNPNVGVITASVNPIQVNTSLGAAAIFTDPGIFDTHTAVWNWGDGVTSNGTVSENNGSGSVSGSHNYTAGGVYEITLTVTDSDNGVGTSFYQYQTVYDVNAGWAAGGKEFTSPVGAVASNPSATGKADFGFQVKYQQGDPMPSGKNIEFSFPAGNIDFTSSAYEWLVVSGTKATLKATGTVNGTSGYTMLISAIDQGNGQQNGLIRVQIKNGNTTVYDTQPGAADTANPTTVVSKGKIAVH